MYVRVKYYLDRTAWLEEVEVALREMAGDSTDSQ